MAISRSSPVESRRQRSQRQAPESAVHLPLIHREVELMLLLKQGSATLPRTKLTCCVTRNVGSVQVRNMFLPSVGNF